MNQLEKTVDIVSIPLCIWLANFTRFQVAAFTLREDFLLISAITIWFILSSLTGYYERHDSHFSPRGIWQRISLSLFFFFGLTGAVFYTHNELDFSRIMIFLFVLYQFSLPWLFTQMLHLLLNRKDHPSHYPITLLGHGERFHQLQSEIAAERLQILNTEKLLSTEIALSLQNQFRKQRSELIVIALPFPNRAVNDAILEFSRDQGVRCQIVVDTRGVITSSVTSQAFEGYTLYQPLSSSLEKSDHRIIKRVFDILFGTFSLTVFSPLMLVTGILVKLSSPKEPIIYGQTRTGYNQKQFTCYKFRSMKTVPHEIADSLQAVKDDPRLTPLGSFMRRWNIDELPQLINVIRGDMSLVGPRPHPSRLQYDAHFQEIVPNYLMRHFVVPGMTGWAQVNGYRGPTDTEEKIRGRVEHDLWYIEHWSIWLDIKIMFLTLFGRKVRENAF